MAMTDAVQKHLDGYLTDLGFVDLARRRAALDEALPRFAPQGWERWPEDRRTLAAEQLVYLWTGIEVGDIDGLAGPQTAAARDAYAHWREHGTLPDWRDADPVETDDPVLPSRTTFPLQRDMSRFYGHPGPAVEAQLVFVPCPWELKIAWDIRQKTRRIRIHRKCADSLAEVLERQWEHYGERGLEAIGVHLYGGSYNHRRMRGGSSWSTHAYAAAIDWDPARNALRTKAPHARLSHADARDWWEIWEAAGWLSLGRARGFDWMHVQAALLG